MIFDKQNLFSDGQAITGSAGSDNVIDLGAVGTPSGDKQALRRDIGRGGKIPLVVQVVEDFAGLTNLTVTVETSDDPAFGADVRTHASSGAVALSKLKAGYAFFPDFVPMADAEGMARYLRVNYTKSGSNASAGKITAGITAGLQTNG